MHNISLYRDLVYNQNEMSTNSFSIVAYFYNALAMLLVVRFHLAQSFGLNARYPPRVITSRKVSKDDNFVIHKY